MLLCVVGQWQWTGFISPSYFFISAKISFLSLPPNSLEDRPLKVFCWKISPYCLIAIVSFAKDSLDHIFWPHWQKHFIRLFSFLLCSGNLGRGVAKSTYPTLQISSASLQMFYRALITLKRLLYYPASSRLITSKLLFYFPWKRRWKKWLTYHTNVGPWGEGWGLIGYPSSNWEKPPEKPEIGLIHYLLLTSANFLHWKQF